jgi:acetoin:2,6-dichlorophenolindophenol oxidoreductase subunit beta
MRELTYAKAINEALTQAMDLCPDVIVLGQLVNYSRAGIFGTTTGLVERFGQSRVQDFPVAESLMTSAAMGAALAGLRPVLVHQRQDFMYYSLDAIANWLSLWRFKSNGHSSLPVVIRTIVGKGWGQGPQHSKSVHAWFSHLPGLRVAMPATPYDAKGLLLESIFGENPVIFVEHRALFSMKGGVPERPYRVHFGKASVRRPGKDVTLVSLGGFLPAVLRAADVLAEKSLAAEVLDLRTASPWDAEAVFQSVAKTRRLVVADPGWEQAGMAAEVVARVSLKFATDLAANPVRITLPQSHTPASSRLEALYYPTENTIVDRVVAMFPS